MKENKIGGIPVVDADRKLIGIVTNRDLRFQRDMSRRIEEDVYKRQQYSSLPRSITLSRLATPTISAKFRTEAGV